MIVNFESSKEILEITSGICNIIFGVLTLVLAFYVFVYQKDKDSREELNRIFEHRKNIKLQWFKDIIIEPKINELFEYFNELNTLKDRFRSSDITDDDKIEIIEFVKERHREIRKSFLVNIQSIDIELFNEINKELDLLTDDLTAAISNDELKLNNTTTYDREIKERIGVKSNTVLKIIFSYS